MLVSDVCAMVVLQQAGLVAVVGLLNACLLCWTTIGQNGSLVLIV
jgi:hypothetical protein